MEISSKSDTLTEDGFFARDFYLGLSLNFKGGGVHPDYFVKLDFEIAVDQQTRARDQTFEGVPDSG